MDGFALKLKNSFCTSFFPKTSLQDFSPQKSLESILDLYATVTSGKKSEKFHALVFTKLLIVGAYFGPLLVQTLFQKHNFVQFQAFLLLYLNVQN